MTQTNFLVFIVSLFFPNNTFENDNTDIVSNNLFLSHYDCSKMQDYRMYSLIQVAGCKMAPETIYIAPATTTS